MPLSDYMYHYQILPHHKNNLCHIAILFAAYRIMCGGNRIVGDLSDIWRIIERINESWILSRISESANHLTNYQPYQIWASEPHHHRIEPQSPNHIWYCTTIRIYIRPYQIMGLYQRIATNHSYTDHSSWYCYTIRDIKRTLSDSDQPIEIRNHNLFILANRMMNHVKSWMN